MKWFLSLFTVVALSMIPSTGSASSHRSYHSTHRVIVNSVVPKRRTVYLIFPKLHSSAIIRVR